MGGIKPCGNARASLFAPNLLQQANAKGYTERAAADADCRNPAHDGRHLVAPQHRRTEEQGAGDHAHDQPINRRFEPAVLQVDVKLAALDLLKNIAKFARERLQKLLRFYSCHKLPE